MAGRLHADGADRRQRPRLRGNAGGDQPGVTGHVYALDARDGHVVWRFDVVPDDSAGRAT